MTSYVVLSEAEAASVAGDTARGHALQPVRLTDGRFVLPLAVLDDPAHAGRRDYLLRHGTIEDIAPELFYRPASRRPR